MAEQMETWLLVLAPKIEAQYDEVPGREGYATDKEMREALIRIFYREARKQFPNRGIEILESGTWIHWNPAWGDPNRHVVEFREDGWGLQHPLACRPDLIGCAFNRAMDALDEPPSLGRWVVELNEEGDPVYVKQLEETHG